MNKLIDRLFIVLNIGIIFRIGSFVWIKGTDNKLHLKKMKIKGTAGQCLILSHNIVTLLLFEVFGIMGLVLAVTNLLFI